MNFNSPTLKLNTYENVCGTEQELLAWFDNNVYKGRTLIGPQPSDQLREISNSKEKCGTVAFFFQNSDKTSSKLETIFVGINNKNTAENIPEIITPHKNKPTMKPKLLIFDGLDRVGKSTTIKKVWKARGGIDSCIDRGILSNLVYNIWYKRSIDRKDYLKLMPDVSNVVYIYMTADIDAIKQRAIDSNDDAYTVEQLKQQKSLFDDAFTWLSCQYDNVKFLTVDATGTQDEVVNWILKEIE